MREEEKVRWISIDGILNLRMKENLTSTRVPIVLYF
jgi:hypothetical protein